MLIAIAVGAAVFIVCDIADKFYKGGVKSKDAYKIVKPNLPKEVKHVQKSRS